MLLTSCSTEEPAHPVGRAVFRTQGETNMYQVADDDVQMERATHHARRTVSRFIAALQHPSPGDRNFGVKKLFVKDDMAEHIWLADVHFNGNRFVGVVDNRPLHIAGLKIGDRVSVNPDEITDWLYVHDGQLVGGYTVRVLAAEMPPAERDDFEKRSKFHIAR